MLSHGSLILIMAGLLMAGMGVPIPEDIMLLTAGVLAHRQVTWLPLTIIVCAFGVLGGDTLLFFTARRLGTKALERPFFQKLLPPARRQRLQYWFRRYGMLVIFVARYMSGFRAAVFAMAGIENMPIYKFILADGIGLCISVPLVVSLGYYFSNHLDKVRHAMGQTEHYLLLLLVGGIVFYSVWFHVRNYRERRG